MKKAATGRLCCLTIASCFFVMASFGSPGPASAATVLDKGAKPLAECLDQLQPAQVFKDFYLLTQIPRPTHREQKVGAFLVSFGHSLNLETVTDNAGNVIIRKPATPGLENLRGVILQAHMDMVPQKTSDRTFDFLKDPVSAYVTPDGYLTADRTTLGADDGIGVAMIMALLQDKGIAHGPLEALFTTDEEDTMTGANGLKPGVLKGDFLINVDSEEEGVFTIGSAGGVHVDGFSSYREERVPAGMQAYRVTIKGLKGGHSGADIHKGLGSASKLMVRLLWSADAFGVRVASIDAGDRYNAITREAVALVVVPAGKAPGFEEYVKTFDKSAKAELAAVDPGLSAAAARADAPKRVMNAKAQASMLAAVYGSINGVQRMSDAVPGLVETSTSLGIFKVGGGTWTAGMFARSSVDSSRDDTANRLVAVFRLAGAQTRISGQFTGWNPNPASPLLAVMKTVYREKFGSDPKVEAIHAGLETGVFSGKYPNWDMISLGPTLQNVHTPDERLEIATTAKVYDLLAETLKRIPVK
jgi:dipeptidase D